VIRKLQHQKSRLAAKTTKTSQASVDLSTIIQLANDSENLDSRMRLRNLAHQSISAIRLTKIDAQNWHVMVHGYVMTSDGKKHSFRYAYCTRRIGYIMCDRPDGALHQDGDPSNVLTETITDDVKAELAKFPTRREWEKTVSDFTPKNQPSGRRNFLLEMSPRNLGVTFKSLSEQEEENTGRII
jgi:hypothetical protein